MEYGMGTGSTVVLERQSLHALLLRHDIGKGPALVAHVVTAVAAAAAATWVWRSDQPYALNQHVEHPPIEKRFPRFRSMA